MTLEIYDLAIARGGVTVIEGLSFQVPDGTALVIRGPNGIGKTTLLRTLVGLQPPMHGQIIGAEDQIAYGAHADGIKPTLSVSENLTFWARVFATKGIEAALDAFDLHALADRAAGSLSAGQKRRLGLARLMATGRPIWVLDEPTVSLDTRAVGLFADAVRGHLAGGGSALIATHIDLGIEAKVLDLTPYKARPPVFDDSDEAFL